MFAGIQSLLFIICVFHSIRSLIHCSDILAVYFHFSFLLFSLSFLPSFMRLCSYIIILNINKFRSEIFYDLCASVCMYMWKKNPKSIECICVCKQWNDCRPTTAEKFWHTENVAVRHLLYVCVCLNSYCVHMLNVFHQVWFIFVCFLFFIEEEFKHATLHYPFCLCQCVRNNKKTCATFAWFFCVALFITPWF